MAPAKALASFNAPPDLDEPLPELPAATPDAPLAHTLPHCANCDAPMHGPFCAQCGQHTQDFHRSVRRLVGEFFDNTFCWDNKFVQTLRPLIRQPGLLTREYLEGHRVRYVQPLRLFLFVSAVCLTLLQVFHGGMFRVQVGRDKARKAKQHQVEQATPAVGQATPAVEPSPLAAPVLSAEAQAELAHDRQTQAIRNQIKEAMDKKINHTDPVVLTRNLNEAIQHRLSWVALALLPFFALILQAMYWRRDHFYFAHLIFSLHYHTFLLLFWTALTGWDAVANFAWFLHWLDPLNVLWMCIPAVYLYLALRRVYGGTPKRTALRVFVIGCLHLLALTIGVAAAGAPAFFMKH